jgi:glycerol-3-phosphate acyltransferase PlsY
LLRNVTVADACVYLIGIAASYLFAGLPFGFIVVKAAKGIDIRTVGSGNIGATNVARILGKGGFALVFILDFLKGFLPVVLFTLVLARWGPDVSKVNLRVLLGLGAIIGHMFTPYLKFKGGKGVATSCGVFFGLAPLAAAIALLVWLLVFGLSRYVSLSSISAAAALPIAFIVTGVVRGNAPFGKEAPVTAFCIAIAVLVIVKHTSNVKRLLAGTENKFERKKDRPQA